MKRDYLWDRSGEPDPEIQKLENLLGTLRSSAPAPDFPELPRPEQRPPRPWITLYLRSAFALPALGGVVLILAGVWWFQRLGTYAVVTLNGTPTLAESRISGSGRLRAGQWLETDASSRARIEVADIGVIEIDPNTRIGLVQARATDHRLSLARGTMHAFVWAPPRQFSVDTPSARAVDLGCGYMLQVDDDGAGILKVISGWVAFEKGGRESFVPAGAMCETRPEAGPGTPYQQDVSRAFRSALNELDFGAGNDQLRAAAFESVLGEARREDAFTLWHLLGRVHEAERPRVYDRLAELVPPPAGVNREGVLGRDRQMIDRWWNQLGLGDLEGWRLWKRPWDTSR